MCDRPRPADTGKVSHYTVLSLGEYIVMTVVPLILLLVWAIAMYRADRYPEWRRGTPQQSAEAPAIGPGGVGLGRPVAGPLQVPVEPVTGTESRPGEPGAR